MVKKPITRRKSPASKTAKKTPAVSEIAALARLLEQHPLNEVITKDLAEYAKYVIEERAIPSFQDGLKPSQRRILWALYYADGLGNRPEKGYIKAARIEGAAYQYHPHGSAYGTLVKMIEGTPAPLLTGYGNFGSFSKLNSPPAAARYPEAKLSHFTMAMMFSKRFEKTYPLIPNFDGSSKEPVYLPAQLPMIMALGASGIAVGVTTDIPSFTIPSIFTAVKLALKAKNYTVDAKVLANVLEFSSAYGGKMVSQTKDVVSLMKTGIGKINWQCDYAIKGNEIHITGMPPNWNFDTVFDKLRAHKNVNEAVDISSGSGIHIRITTKRLNEDDLFTTMKQLKALLHVSKTYRCNVTKRIYLPDELVDGTNVEFMKVSIVEMLAMWVKFRVGLEKKALKAEYGDLKVAYERMRLLLLATRNLDIIFALLKKKGVADKNAELAKALKITVDQAKEIWAIAVGRLDRLSEDAILKQIAENKQRREEIKVLITTPEKSILQHLTANEKDLINPVAYEYTDD